MTDSAPRPQRPQQPRLRRAWRRALAAGAAALLFGPAAQAAVGLLELAATAQEPALVLLYPTAAVAQTVQRGPTRLVLAPQAAPERGNGRLVVISHGSGGTPWVHADQARALVEAGFVVALPWHAGDNALDRGDLGPPSWRRRPVEVSRAIDAVGREPQLAPLLALDRVGVYGMSAGGHTALTLAGGRWSTARLRDHCEVHLEEDFHSCVGLATRLTGGWADPLKRSVARALIRWRMDDPTPQGHSDPRIAAALAGVPFAVDFDPATLAQPKVPLGLVTAGQDLWLLPRFHAEAVLKACTGCEHVAHLPTGGHGALISPMPPGLEGLARDLIADPPGFDRSSELPAVEGRITDFFRRHLLGR